ncbi:unnamed protein product [Prorocentrum cordatum]|uniref:Uncharacterized protein n=1 Tax=Prorocentrum cordatum TaxID=2364126 RepID=A0ABN9SNS1_9DINO|nr:unnamed protein product [Polarella glacialis]
MQRLEQRVVDSQKDCQKMVHKIRGELAGSEDRLSKSVSRLSDAFTGLVNGKLSEERLRELSWQAAVCQLPVWLHQMGAADEQSEESLQAFFGRIRDDLDSERGARSRDFATLQGMLQRQTAQLHEGHQRVSDQLQELDQQFIQLLDRQLEGLEQRLAGQLMHLDQELAVQVERARQGLEVRLEALAHEAAPPAAAALADAPAALGPQAAAPTPQAAPPSLAAVPPPPAAAAAPPRAAAAASPRVASPRGAAAPRVPEATAGAARLPRAARPEAEAAPPGEGGSVGDGALATRCAQVEQAVDEIRSMLGGVGEQLGACLHDVAVLRGDWAPRMASDLEEAVGLCLERIEAKGAELQEQLDRLYPPVVFEGGQHAKVSEARLYSMDRRLRHLEEGCARSQSWPPSQRSPGRPSHGQPGAAPWGAPDLQLTSSIGIAGAGAAALGPPDLDRRRRGDARPTGATALPPGAPPGRRALPREGSQQPQAGPLLAGRARRGRPRGAARRPRQLRRRARERAGAAAGLARQQACTGLRGAALGRGPEASLLARERGRRRSRAPAQCCGGPQRAAAAGIHGGEAGAGEQREGEAASRRGAGGRADGRRGFPHGEAARSQSPAGLGHPGRWGLRPGGARGGESRGQGAAPLADQAC